MHRNYQYWYYINNIYIYIYIYRNYQNMGLVKHGFKTIERLIWYSMINCNTEIFHICNFFHNTEKVLTYKRRVKNKVSWTKLWFWASVRIFFKFTLGFEKCKVNPINKSCCKVVGNVKELAKDGTSWWEILY